MANLVALTSIVNHTSQLYGSFGSTFEMVALGADKYLVTYGAGNDWNYQAGSGYDIRGEIWNTNGTLAVSRFFIPEIRGGDQQDLSVVERPGGGFTAAWSARLIQSNGSYNTGNLGPQDSVRMASFDVNGARIGSEVAFEPGGSLPNWGGVAVSYSDNTNSSFPLVAGSAYNSDTDMIIMSEVAPNFIGFGATRANSQFYYQMTERSGPALTISWYESVSGQAYLKGGIIDGINQPIYAEWVVPLTTGAGGTPSTFYSQDVAYEVTVLTTGETVVGYDDVNGGGLVKFRIFNADGSGGGTPLYVSIDDSAEALAAGEEGIAVHALNDGGFVAAWKQLGYTNAANQLVPTGIYMRAYDNTGNATGAAVLVKAETSSTSYLDIDIDVGDDGAIVIGWIEYSSNSGVGGTYSRVLREQTQVTGTPDGEILSGTLALEGFSGLGGFDMVSYAFAPAKVRASLQDPVSNLGAATGDTYTSIEGLAGSAYADSLYGDGFGNQLEGLGGSDLLSGGSGNDTLIGGAGGDAMFGGMDNDLYSVDSVGDRIYESVGEGSDTVIAALNYRILATAEIEVFNAAAGIDPLSLIGNGYGQSMTGNDGANRLFGMVGADTLIGGAGNDSLYGGVGNDSLTGGAGLDSFVFDTAPNRVTNSDVITDFNIADDRFLLDDAAFVGIGALGALGARFVVGSAATLATHRIVYEQSTGKVFYDANGNVAGGQIQFAQVTAGTALTSADFLIY
jgi:Ca2+-binding RTX toxin-like protein